MFVGTPFEKKTLTSTFQRVMHSLFKYKSLVMVYVDDLLIHSSSLEEHIAHVSEVIQILTSVNLTINSEKGKFGFSKLVYLAHMISSDGVLPDPLKLVTLRDWPLPKTGTDVPSIFSVANYFRDFIPRFSELSAPLESLKSLSSIQSLSAEQLAAFNNIKTSLLNSKILSYPDFSKPFFLATDASNVAVGAVLYQDTEENALRFRSPTRKFIGFFFKSSSPTERRYSANKKELLAVVKALHHFRYYLFGNPDKFSAGDQVYKLNYDRRSKFNPVKAGPFIVERILNHREHEGETYYLVKWLGYDSYSNTWEPTHSFLDTSVIDRYWESLDLRGGNVNI
jgi:putative transposase